jgi:hypothetical protein
VANAKRYNTLLFIGIVVSDKKCRAKGWMPKGEIKVVTRKRGSK